MQEFNAEEVRFETVSAIGTIRQAEELIRYPAYIGLDVHKETIAVAVARASRQEPEFRLSISRRRLPNWLHA